jgi:hypothetical protein
MPSYAEITSRPATAAPATAAPSSDCLILDDDELERRQGVPKRIWRTAEQLAAERMFSAKGVAAASTFPNAFQSYRPGKGGTTWGPRTTPVQPSSSTEPPGTLQRAVRTVFYDAEKGMWAPITAPVPVTEPAVVAAYSPKTPPYWDDLSGNSNLSLE